MAGLCYAKAPILDTLMQMGSCNFKFEEVYHFPQLLLAGDDLQAYENDLSRWNYTQKGEIMGLNEHYDYLSNVLRELVFFPHVNMNESKFYLSCHRR